MESSRVNIVLPNQNAVNIYASSSIAVGTRLVLQNLSSTPVFVYLGATYQGGYGFAVKPFEYYYVPSGTLGCFVAVSTVGGGQIAVTAGGWEFPNQPIDERVYNGLKGLTMQSFVEANSKNGTQFELGFSNDTLAAGASMHLILTTGSKSVLIKNRQVTFTSAVNETTVYKAPTFTVGTSIPTFNMNTELLYPSLTTAKTNATITNNGTQVSATTVTYGANASENKAVGTYSATGAERVLQANTSYLLLITNKDTVTSKVAVYISFYEGELSSLN